MHVARWILVGMVGLLIVGCASTDLADVDPDRERLAASADIDLTSGPRSTVAAPRALTVAPTSTAVSGPSAPTLPASTPTDASSPLALTRIRPLRTDVPDEILGDVTIAGDRRRRPQTVGVNVRILYDNNPGDNGRLRTAWGFSCLVEGLEKTVLFDTGGDSATLFHNMRVLEVEPQDIEVVVISHIHGDHVGGLTGLLAENHAVAVYLPQSFPGDVKNAVERAGAELVEVDGPVEICENLYSTGELGDRIKEQSLVVETPQGLVVITGCAHPGIVGIVCQAKELREQEVHLALGGFHLGGLSAAELDDIVEDFRRIGVQKVAPCHCSGDLARQRFEESYGEDFIVAGVGSVLEVRD